MSSSAAMNGVKTILFVDDAHDTGELLALRLEAEGFRTLLAERDEEVMRALDEEEVSLVLVAESTDEPTRSLVSRIRAGHAVPIVVMVHSDARPTRFGGAVQALLLKPVSPPQLVDALKALIGAP